MDGSTRPITYERAFVLDENELINVDAVYPREQAGAAGSAERALLSLQPVK